jgi:deoxyribonuclease I
MAVSLEVIVLLARRATLPLVAASFSLGQIAGRKTEPRPDIRGDIARTYFYMNAAYPGRGIISRQNAKLFEAWDKEDPVDDWERERAQRIEQIQGNRHPFVK